VMTSLSSSSLSLLASPASSTSTPCILDGFLRCEHLPQVMRGFTVVSCCRQPAPHRPNRHDTFISCTRDRCL
jgi:hypothetical protein